MQAAIDTATGGESFCYMGFYYLRNPAIPAFMHQGKYPLYGVTARIVDVSKVLKDAAAHKPYDLAAEIHVDLQEMTPGHLKIREANPIPFSEPDDQSISIAFDARNGSWTQRMLVKKIDGQWTTATRVDGFGKHLYERVTKGFPRQPDGSIDWDDAEHTAKPLPATPPAQP